MIFFINRKKMGLTILSFSKLTEGVHIRARVINFGFHGKTFRKVPICQFNNSNKTADDLVISFSI